MSWNEIDGATYKIYIDGILKATISTNSIDLSTLVTTNGTYTVEVETVEFDDYTLPSDKVEIKYEPDFGYYDNIGNDLVGNALKLQLRELLVDTHISKRTYDNLKNDILYTDASLTNPNKLVLFYSRIEINAVWDADYWNREHVWPKSLGWFNESGAGSDLHHIRPSDPSVNGSKGSKKLGNANGGNAVMISLLNGGGFSGCYSNTSYFEPSDESKGDVARIIFYLFTRYSESEAYNFTSVAQSLDTLLDWHKNDPVDEFELRRNDRTSEIQGNRNPFIDHPEYALKIWG